jgi:hypothetical protein
MTIQLSKYPGISATANSVAAFNAAVAEAVANKQNLLLDCHVLLDQGTDPSQGIIIPSGLTVTGTPEGAFLMTNAQQPGFTFQHCNGGAWTDINILYQGSTPVKMVGTGPGGVFNDVYLTQDLIKNHGCTLAHGVHALYTGPTNLCATFRIVGACNDLTFTGIIITGGATADKFVATLFSFDAQWKPGSTIAIDTPQNSSYLVLPVGIQIIDCRFDGYLMGFVGCAGGLLAQGNVFARYADLQDAHGGTIGGIINGIDTWFSPPHAFYMADPDVGSGFTGIRRQLLSNIDLGVWSGAGRRPSISGTLPSLKTTLMYTEVDGYTSYRPDGIMSITSDQNVPCQGSMKNVHGQFDSRVSYPNAGGNNFGVNFPGNANYNGLKIDTVTAIDINPGVPAYPPFPSIQYPGDSNCSFTNIVQYSNFPGPIKPIVGTNMVFESTLKPLKDLPTTPPVTPQAFTGTITIDGQTGNFSGTLPQTGTSIMSGTPFTGTLTINGQTGSFTGTLDPATVVPPDPPPSSTLKVVIAQNGKLNPAWTQDYSYSATDKVSQPGNGNPNCIQVTTTGPWGGYQPSNTNGAATDFSQCTHLTVSISAPAGKSYSMQYLKGGDQPINAPGFLMTKTKDGYETFTVAKSQVMYDNGVDVSAAIYKGAIQSKQGQGGDVFLVDDWGGM